MCEELQEVRFDKYCPTCEYKKRKEYEEPCNSCLDEPAILNSSKPKYYKKKETVKNGRNRN